MADTGAALPRPPEYKDWPPESPSKLIQEIEEAFAAREGGTKGEHWAVKVFGHNPISGYAIHVVQKR